VSTTLRCQVRQVPDEASEASALELTPPPWMPDVVAGEFAGDGLTSVLLLNLHPSSSVTNLSVTIPIRAAAGKKQRPYVAVDAARQPAAAGPAHVAPGQMVGIHVALRVENGDAGRRDDESVCPAPFRLVVRGLVAADGRWVEVGSESVQVRCRKRENQSFLISFVDHDGSVNRAAVIPPLQGCRYLSTHDGS
jgi:hypothetical protein